VDPYITKCDLKYATMTFQEIKKKIEIYWLKMYLYMLSYSLLGNINTIEEKLDIPRDQKKYGIESKSR
jgi:hypothetical protein